jgi:polyisoprenoid-binding protein YceI
MTDTDIAPASTDLPAPGTWYLDLAHSSVNFTARHLMVSKVRGRFNFFEGTIEVGATPEESSVTASIAADTVYTGQEQRDGHLRSPDFFDVATHPRIEFRSTRVERKGSDWLLHGDLTIRDVTRPVVLDVEFFGLATDPWGGTRMAFNAVTSIDREAFGLTWNQVLEGGRLLVSKKIDVELEIQATTTPPQG